MTRAVVACVIVLAGESALRAGQTQEPASTQSAMTSPNDQLRAVACSFFEHHPDRQLGPRLLAALDKEPGEAAEGSPSRVLIQSLIGKLDF